MISDLTRDYLASAKPDPQAVEFFYGLAKTSKDIETLVILAKRNDLPDGVAEDIKTVAMAPVVTARLTRQGVSHAELVAAGSDKRVGVQIAVASAGKLPDEVYAALLAKASSPKPLLALACNEEAGMAWRIKAAAAACAHERLSALTWSQGHQLSKVIEELIVKNPDAASAIVSAGPDLQVQHQLVRLAATPPEVSSYLVKKQLEFFDQVNWSELQAEAKALASSSRRWWANPFNRHSARYKVLTAATEFDDFDVELYKQIEALARKADALMTGNSTLLTELRGRRGKRTRAQAHVEGNLDAVLASGTDIGRRLELLNSAELADEEFIQLIRKGTRTLTVTDPDYFPPWLEGLLAQGTSPAKAAALLSRFVLPKAQFKALAGQDPAHLIGTLDSYRVEENQELTQSMSWQKEAHRVPLLHAGHLIGAEGVGYLPTEAVAWALDENERSSRYAVCCDHAQHDLRLLITEYLWKRFGDKAQAWSAFDSLAAKLPTTIEEAANTVLASTE